MDTPKPNTTWIDKADPASQAETDARAERPSRAQYQYIVIGIDHLPSPVLPNQLPVTVIYTRSDIPGSRWSMPLDEWNQTKAVL